MDEAPETLSYSKWGQGYRNDGSKMAYPAKCFLTAAKSPKIKIVKSGPEYQEVWGAGKAVIDSVRWGEYDPRSHAERSGNADTFWRAVSSEEEVLETFAIAGGGVNLFVKHPGIYMPGSKKDWFVSPALVFMARSVKDLGSSVAAAREIGADEFVIPKRLILGDASAIGTGLRVTQHSRRVYTAKVVDLGAR